MYKATNVATRQINALLVRKNIGNPSILSDQLFHQHHHILVSQLQIPPRGEGTHTTLLLQVQPQFHPHRNRKDSADPSMNRGVCLGVCSACRIYQSQYPGTAYVLDMLGHQGGPRGRSEESVAGVLVEEDETTRVPRARVTRRVTNVEYHNIKQVILTRGKPGQNWCVQENA